MAVIMLNQKRFFNQKGFIQGWKITVQGSECLSRLSSPARLQHKEQQGTETGCDLQVNLSPACPDQHKT